MALKPGLLKGFIIPGHGTDSEYYGAAATLQSPAQIAGVGGNLGVIAYNFFMPSGTGTTITPASSNPPGATGTVPNAQVQAMAQKIAACGMAVGLKPQIIDAVSGNQVTVTPGMQPIENAHYTSGGTVLTSAGAAFTSAINTQGPGGGPARIISSYTPSGSTTGFTDIPGSVTATQYGTGGDLASSTCEYTSATTVTLQGSATFAETQTGSGPYIFIINEAQLATWFTNYTALLDSLLALYPFDFLELDTEHTVLQQAGTSYWRALIAHIRSEYPNIKITVAQELNNYCFNRITFWDALDYIGLDMYQAVQSQAGGESLATIEGYWSSCPGTVNGTGVLRTYLGPSSGGSPTFPAMAAAWSKPYIFSEIGYPSCVGSGYVTGGTSSGVYSAYDQANCLDAMWTQNQLQSGFGGFVYFTWTGGSQFAAGYNPATDDTSFTMQSKQGQSFCAPPRRLVQEATGTVRYRLNTP